MPKSTLNPRRLGSKQSDTTRAKIQTSQIITRLQNHTLGKLKKPMTREQIQAAGILLKHALAPLQPIAPPDEQGDAATHVYIHTLGDAPDTPAK